MTRQRLLQCAAFAVVVWVEWTALSVRSLDAGTFDMHAIELERTRTWRYGYVSHYRGGALVRARLGVGAPPPTPVGAVDGVALAMARELHKQQRAAAVASVLCGLLWALWFNGFLRIRRTLARVNPSRRLQRLQAASSRPPETG